MFAIGIDVEILDQSTFNSRAHIFNHYTCDIERNRERFHNGSSHHHHHYSIEPESHRIEYKIIYFGLECNKKDSIMIAANVTVDIWTLVQSLHHTFIRLTLTNRTPGETERGEIMKKKNILANEWFGFHDVYSRCTFFAICVIDSVSGIHTHRSSISLYFGWRYEMLFTV